MFHDSPLARTTLRAVMAALISFFGAMVTATIDGNVSLNEWMVVGSATVVAFGGWFGLGAAIGPMEPYLGNKLVPTEVPKPPAVTVSGDWRRDAN